jgi:rod shape-determining protein MreD
MNRSLYVAVPLIALLVVLQMSVLPHLQLAGITPQLAIVAAISWALQRGALEGMVWAFLAGMLLDAFSYTPLGITALALMLAIYAITRLQKVLPETPVFMPIIMTGLVFAGYLLLSLLLLRLTGHRFSWANASLLPPSVVFHAVLGLPAYWLASSLDRLLYPRAIEA